MNWCTHCHSKKNLIYYSNGNQKNKKYFICRKCNTEKCKKYRKTKNGTESTRKAVRKYELNNKERRSAWIMARYIHKYKLPCFVCKKSPTHRHHPDIKKPLEIIYLCPVHHKEAHKNMKKVL